ncbi:hypothetical protein DET56_1061, partial [Paenibacillus pabuli]
TLPFYQGKASFCFTIWKTELSLPIFMTYGTAPLCLKLYPEYEGGESVDAFIDF